MLKRPAFYIDIDACTGCKTCMLACIDKNDLPDGVLFRRVTEYAGGRWTTNADGSYRQSVFAYYLSLACNHCQNPICVRSCPTKAMHKDEYGIVSVDQSKCVGCRYCEWCCPYNAPQYDAALEKMTKCVAACPTRALLFGEYEDLAVRYGEADVVAPLPDKGITQPNLVFTPHRNARSAGSRAGAVGNPEEM